MKRVVIIAAAGIMAYLISCRTQKAIQTTDYSSAQSFVDTTKTTTDTAGISVAVIDTTKTAAAYEDIGVIEFVEGGGKVSIDSAGNATFEGVAKIKTRQKGNILQDKGVTQKAEEVASHSEQSNGVQAEQTQKIKSTEEKAPAKKWYDTVLARIGLGVCIAALLWVLFLYLRRRR